MGTGEAKIIKGLVFSSNSNIWNLCVSLCSQVGVYQVLWKIWAIFWAVRRSKRMLDLPEDVKRQQVRRLTRRIPIKADVFGIIKPWELGCKTCAKIFQFRPLRRSCKKCKRCQLFDLSVIGLGLCIFCYLCILCNDSKPCRTLWFYLQEYWVLNTEAFKPIVKLWKDW